MSPLPLIERLRDIAAQTPHSTALLIDGGAVSYEELLARIDRCAFELTERGIGPGQAVAIIFPNSLDFVVGLFATFALGAMAVPLNSQSKAEELQHCIDLTQPKALLHAHQLQTLIDTLRAPNVTQHGAVDVSGVYMFSSGSTGRSKRITRTQEQLLAEYWALRERAALSDQDRILCTLPLFHAHGFCNALLGALLSGAQLVVLTSEFNARATVQALAAQRITIYPAVPVQLRALSETHFSPAPDLSALRLIVSAGAPLARAVSDGFYKQFGKAISQLYGSTETGALTLNAAHALDKPTSVGSALPGSQIFVRNEGGAPLPPMQPGEIWVSSPNAARAYDGLAALTAECFREECFFTGDLGYLDGDGDLFITGRKKLLINVAGYKVDPLEVETVLAAHPAVSDVAVIGVAHGAAGEKVKAVVVLNASVDCSAQHLIEFAATRLSGYKVPQIIEFRTQLPRNAAGKLQRDQL